MKKILISIVIPVYNKEEYLSSTIQSIVAQSYTNLEILIIDDGSTDNSADIIKKWESKDKRIKHILQENQGVAKSRNKGISIAKGEYVFFLDADDYIKKNAIEKLYKALGNEELDIVTANYIKVIDGKERRNIQIKERNIQNEDIITTETKLEMFFFKGRPLASACNKLYRTDFLKINKLCFFDNVLAEDRLFNLMCYVNNPYIKIIDEYLYYYRIMEQSRSRTYSESFLSEVINLIYTFNTYLSEKGIVEENKDLIQIIAVYDLNNILEYIYKYTNSINEMAASLYDIKQNELLEMGITKSRKNNLLKKLNSKGFIYFKYNLLTLLYNNFPSKFTAFVYYYLLKLISYRNKRKKRLV